MIETVAFKDWNEVESVAEQIFSASTQPFDPETIANAHDLLEICRDSCPIPDGIDKGYWSTLCVSWPNFELEVFEDRIEVYHLVPLSIWYEQHTSGQRFSAQFLAELPKTLSETTPISHRICDIHTTPNTLEFPGMPKAAKSPTVPTHLRKEGMAFLRALVRINKTDPVEAREWFNANKAVYEAELKEPMLAIIRHVTDAMLDFAPEHVRPAEKSLFRIYRDTRFSADKRPYKDHIAAWWTHTGLDKTSGAGYYFHISAKEVIIAAGAYMPEKDQLAAIRHWLLDNHAEFRKLLEKPAVKKTFREFDGNALARPPKGFPADHPALDLIRCRQWGLSATLPAEAALKPDLAAEIVRHFKLAAPIIAALNAPIAASLKPRKPVMFGLPQGPKSVKNR